SFVLGVCHEKGDMHRFKELQERAAAAAREVKWCGGTFHRKTLAFPAEMDPLEKK
ncbi:hypothetical protein RUM43_005296, partial [Polyplax serrata]